MTLKPARDIATLSIEFERYGELPLVREAIAKDERLPGDLRDRLLARIDAVTEATPHKLA